jgi:hypothetical protein
MAVVLALAATSASPAAPDDVEAVIRNLDLASWPNSDTAHSPGKHTFADFGFSLVARAHDRARLFRKSDDRTKSFVVMSRDAGTLRMCFHDKFVVMPGSASPMPFDVTTALLVRTSGKGLWTAFPVPGGFMGCVNRPPGGQPKEPNYLFPVPRRPM